MSRPVRTRLSSLVEDAVAAAGPEVDVEVDLSGDAEVDVDAVQVRQALVNLLANAARYGRPPVVLAAGTDGAEAWLAVTDHGDGVPEEFVGELFERFTRASSGAAVRHAGTGFGLYLVRRLAEANGGRVDYARAPGGGACFTLTLPVAPPVG
jgi:signal transduction histidine kinase